MGRKCYNHQIYDLREVELPPELAWRLAPFISAYRPHDVPPTVEELKARGCVRKVRESFNDELREVYFETHGFYPEDHPELVEEELSEKT